MIRSLIIEIMSGMESGCRKWIVPGQRLLVGNQEWADLVVQDSELSEVHFELRCGDSDCQMEHRGQQGHTYLNGNAVQMSSVYDGDTLIAGNTRFRIGIQGGVTRAAPSKKPVPVATSPSKTPALAPAPKPQLDHGSVPASPAAQALLKSAIGSLA